MAEPNGVILAGAAAVVFDLLGIDMKALIWAFAGAFFLQTYSNELVSRMRAFSQITSSGLLGSILGLGLADLMGVSHSQSTFMLCAVCGAGAYPIVLAFVGKLTSVIRGDKNG